jgi:hypothetical protein
MRCHPLGSSALRCRLTTLTLPLVSTSFDLQRQRGLNSCASCSVIVASSVHPILRTTTGLQQKRRLFTITCMVCFSRARKSSNALASCLDVYLVGSGVPRRVIETLAGLGLCHSYFFGNELMNNVAKYAEVRNSQPLPPTPGPITCYSVGQL